MSKLKKAASFGDIHWGAKNNSEQHNQDNLNYIDWFCDQAIQNQADHIVFLGDWFENRSALNVSTLNFSYLGAKKLNDLGIPVYFVVGNHDLYHRNHREVFSTIYFNEFSNFTIINDPTIIEEIETEPLICPFLFPEEYPELAQYLSVSTWWGHFEFKGFVVSGQSNIMQSGPDHSLFKGPKYIFSGHFHKRQSGGNVVYIGNTFPTNYSDANDTARGMMIYDHISQDINFIDWEDCPKYTKTTLSKLLDGETIIHPQSRVICVVDIPITFEESIAIKQQMIEEYDLREFTTEESIAISNAISDTECELVDDEDATVSSVDDMVIQMLGNVDVPTINNETLVKIWRGLK
jgi:DNA repair exonuclease SbcCD nuclease subunit